VLDLVAAHEPAVDAVILTRFDLKFRAPIHTMGVSWGSVNFPFRDGPTYWLKERKVSDLFHVFPFRHLAAVRSALDISGRKSHTAGHHAYLPLTKALGSNKEVHFIDSSRGRGSNIREGDPDPSFLFIDRSCDKFERDCQSQPSQLSTGSNCGLLKPGAVDTGTGHSPRGRDVGGKRKRRGRRGGTIRWR
jgi:hypothetical protein